MGTACQGCSCCTPGPEHFTTTAPPWPLAAPDLRLGDLSPPSVSPNNARAGERLGPPEQAGSGRPRSRWTMRQPGSTLWAWSLPGRRGRGWPIPDVGGATRPARPGPEHDGSDSFRLPLDPGGGERLTGFEKRLQAGHEHRPAVPHHRCRSASGLEVVMNDSQFDQLTNRLDVEGNS